MLTILVIALLAGCGGGSSSASGDGGHARPSGEGTSRSPKNPAFPGIDLANTPLRLEGPIDRESAPKS